jgi:membrane protein implicated in regulation of membrane protease activity
MKKTCGFDKKIVLRYTLLQIPGILILVLIFILIQRWIYLPLWLLLLLAGVWIVKDTVIFFFVWPAYDWQNMKAKNSMNGKLGIVTETLQPDGYVNIEGELWLAELVESGGMAKVGDKIRVVYTKNLKLLVEVIDINT